MINNEKITTGLIIKVTAFPRPVFFFFWSLILEEMCLKGVIEGMSLGHIRSLKIVRSQLTHTFGERVAVVQSLSHVRLFATP